MRLFLFLSFLFPLCADFQPEPLLEEICSAEACLQKFLEKGGEFHSIPEESGFTLLQGDAVYPVCSGGWCRSQTVYALCERFGDNIVLFPPHAAHYGWDPYNGRINHLCNREWENEPDAFCLFFGRDRITRMGCENDARWRQFESDPTPEGLAEITKYYDDHFFGPKSSWQGRTGKRRVYIVFTVNTHIVLHRLVQANESLEDVVVVSVDIEDLASNPPAHLHTTSKSAAAYANLLALFEELFYFEKRS